MLISEVIRVGVFIALIAAVFLTALWTILRGVSRRLSGEPPRGTGQKGPRQKGLRGKWIGRVSLALSGLGILCIGYGYFVEPNWLEVTRVRLQSPKLKGASRPVRIVHLSDLHCESEPRLEERLPDVVAAEAPDLIVFTGDSLNTPRALPVFQRCLSRLAKIAPTYVVKGNWDIHFSRNYELFAGTGARELDGDAVRLQVAGAELCISGAGAWPPNRVPEALAAMPRDAFSIFLHHYPDSIHEAAAGGADLYCAGHTHGGQVALPFYGALVTLSRFGKAFEAGLYRVEQTWLYVNRGIGMEGGHFPRVRFCSRPEVTVIEIAPGS